MRRAILAALLCLCALPAIGKADRYGYRDARRTVALWYDRFLGREAGPAAEGWARALAEGQDADRLLSQIIGGTEYFDKCGANPARYVRTLYRDLAGRAPSPREMEYWTRRCRFESRDTIAYEMLRRHPQNWDRDDRRGGRDWDHGDRYDYRRPTYRYR